MVVTGSRYHNIMDELIKNYSRRNKIIENKAQKDSSRTTLSLLIKILEMPNKIIKNQITWLSTTILLLNSNLHLRGCSFRKEIKLKINKDRMKLRINKIFNNRKYKIELLSDLENHQYPANYNQQKKDCPYSRIPKINTY